MLLRGPATSAATQCRGCHCALATACPSISTCPTSWRTSFRLCSASSRPLPASGLSRQQTLQQRDMLHRRARHSQQVAGGAHTVLGLLADGQADTVEGVLPLLIAPVLAFTIGVVALRFWLYSQLEYVTAAMLSNHAPRGVGATVLQLGGGPKQLYYYPKDTTLVVNVGPSVNKGLMEQAGMTAAVPTLARTAAFTDLDFQPPSSCDAVVTLGALADTSSSAHATLLAQALRVLKPGCPLIFVERVETGASPLRPLLAANPRTNVTSPELLASALTAAGFEAPAWDVALGSQDPHVLGVATKPLKGRPSAVAGAQEPEPVSLRSMRRNPSSRGASSNKGFKG